MKWMLLLATALLSLTPLSAQIELPEYLLPDNFVEPPPPPPPPTAEPEVSETDASRERVLQMMGSPVRIRSWKLPGDPPEANLPEEAGRLLGLLEGPEEMEVEIRLLQGGVLHGRVVNQVWMVRAPFGLTPLRLGKVRQLLRNDAGEFDMELADGDFLQGLPQGDSLNLRLSDGGTRTLGLAELRGLTISPPAAPPE